MAGPKYPNQQLRSVSLETFFPGRLSAYAVLGQVQDAVIDRLPNLFVPNAQDGDALALRPFQLRDEFQKRSLAIAVNQVSFVSFDYPGADAFLEESIELVTKALTIVSPPTLSRVVYRYENQLGVARESDGTVAIEKLFPGVLPGGAAAVTCAAIDSKVEGRWQRGDAHGNVGHHVRVEQELGLELLRVQVFASVEAPAISALQSASHLAHDVALEHFEKIYQ